MVFRDGVGDILNEHGLAGAGRGDDQAALPLADGSDQLHHPGRHILRAGLQFQLLHGIEGSQVIEKNLVPGYFG